MTEHEIAADKLSTIHPDKVLLHEFLKPLALGQRRLALNIRVPARRINEIVHGKRRNVPVSYTHLTLPTNREV